jgi:uncharacterized protein (TIGR02186 family)
MKRTLMTGMKQWAAMAVAAVAMVTVPVAARALTCEVTPAKVPITLSYHGARLTITGQSALNDELVLKVSTPPTDTEMKYQGKAGGLFWMKKGSMEFKGVPVVYLVNSTARLDLILGEAERQQHQLGYDAMAKDVTVADGKGQPVERKWFEEFIRFKEKEMVYSIQEGTITRKQGEKGNAFEVVVDWPYQAPPGVYNVEVMAVNAGRVVDKAATTFEVERVGITAALSKMAVDQAALYGIMAVVIAMMAGFAVGAIFKKGGGSH